MTEIMPNLLIGNWREAEQCLNSHHVVTVAHDSPVTGIKKFAMVDGPGNPPELVVAAGKYVEEAVRAGFPTLVHSHSGRSRSATVVVAAMMRLTKRSLCECYDQLKDRHEITRIHPHLSLILLMNELEIRG